MAEELERRAVKAEARAEESERRALDAERKALDAEARHKNQREELRMVLEKGEQ